MVLEIPVCHQKENLTCFVGVPAITSAIGALKRTVPRQVALFLAMTEMISAVYESHVPGASTSCKHYLRTVKKDNKPLMVLLTTVVRLLWVFCSVMVATLFVQCILRKPHTDGVALMAGYAREVVTKVNIDSGASRYFLFDARLFVSWDNNVLSIKINTSPVFLSHPGLWAP